MKGRETFYRRHTVPVTSCSEVKYVLKRVSFGSKDCTKELKLECAYYPLIVSKFHNENHDPKGQENKIYAIVKGRETFYRRHTVPVTSCSEVKYVLKRVSSGSKDCTKELKLECAYYPLIVSKFHNENHDPKGHENKIYAIVKGRETFYRRHTVPVTNCSEVKYVLKGLDSNRIRTNPSLCN